MIGEGDRFWRLENGKFRKEKGKWRTYGRRRDKEAKENQVFSPQPCPAVHGRGRGHPEASLSVAEDVPAASRGRAGKEGEK